MPPHDAPTDSGSAEEQLAFYIFGPDPAELDHLWEHDVYQEDHPNSGCDHEAHEAATKVMELLQEEYDWGEDISGVALATR